MLSALDLRIDKSIANLSVEGGPLPLGSFTLPCGVSVPMISAAPATVGDYFAHFCAQHGDADFIVDGEERLSFAQVYAAATDVAHALVSVHGVNKGDRVGIAMRNAPSWIVLYMGTIMAGVSRSCSTDGGRVANCAPASPMSGARSPLPIRRAPNGLRNAAVIPAVRL
jgi:hypothetical protein